MDITFTIPQVQAQRAIDGVAYNNGYRDTVPDQDGAMIPNPQSKAAFAKEVIRQFIIDNVRAYETRTATNDLSVT